MDPYQSALGMIETWGVPALIAAADAAAKTADVRVTAYEKADAGLVTVYIWGDVASVKAAVEAGEAAARSVGKLISAHVIPRPDRELVAMLHPETRKQAAAAPVVPAAPAVPRITAPAPKPNVPAGGSPNLDAMPVQELRRLARSTPGFPLSGRQISAAGKAVLLRLLTGQTE